MKLRSAIHWYHCVIVTYLGGLRCLSFQTLPVILQDSQFEDRWISDMVWMVDSKMFSKSIRLKISLDLRSVIFRPQISAPASFSKVPCNSSVGMTDGAFSTVHCSSPCVGSSLQTSFTEEAVLPEASGEVSLD